MRTVLALALVALSVLLGVEAGFRLLFWPQVRLRVDPMPPESTFVLADLYRRSPDPELGYEPKPGARVRMNDEVVYNEQTLPEPGLVPVPKPAGQTRVVVVGDSITQGMGLHRVAEIYTNVVEGALRAAGADVDVINLGVPAYDTRRELLRLRLRGLPLQPDVVVVGYCMNDAFDINTLLFATNRAAYRDYLRYLERLDPVLAAQRPLREPCALCLRWVQYLVYKVRERRIADTIPDYIRRSHEDPETWGQVERAMEGIVADATRVGAKTVLLIFPELPPEPIDAARYRYAAARDQVAALGRRLGMEVVDLVGPFAGQRLRLSETDDMHPNPLGHRIAARELLAALARLGIPPAAARARIAVEGAP
jgi:lysophospholipase L1-like esterase